MKFRVIMTHSAMAEMDLAYAWIAGFSTSAAERWKHRLLKAVDSLENLPARCGLAPEAGSFGREIRQLLFGKRSGIYRILFEIREDTVVVLGIRHGARRFLGDE
jgi:plasmid stabilization system protein ParE